MGIILLSLNRRRLHICDKKISFFLFSFRANEQNRRSMMTRFIPTLELILNKKIKKKEIEQKNHINPATAHYFAVCVRVLLDI
jgi:hypothetical protein